MGITSSSLTLNKSLLGHIRNCVAEGLNTNDKIPKVILIGLGQYFAKYSEVAEWVFQWLINEARCSIMVYRDSIPPRARPIESTIFVIVKPVPKPTWADIQGMFKYNRRKLMKALDKYTPETQNVFAVHVDTIRPHDTNLFDTAAKLNHNSHEVYWYFVSYEVENIMKELVNANNNNQPVQRPRQPNRRRRFVKPKYWKNRN